MKKYIMIIVCLCILSGNAYAFDITEIKPDDSAIKSIGRDVVADKMYLKSVAMGYSGRFVVREENTADISVIDEFYSRLSTPITLGEIDNGKAELDISYVGSNEYQKKLNFLKCFGGLSGYSAEFEPIAYYSIYRNIKLVGGYVKYNKTYENPDDAYWQCLCKIEDMTKEVVPYETRLKLLDKVRELSSFIDNDKTFKIFILKNGKIDSMWEGVDAVG